MSSSAAAAQFKLDANSNAIALIADVATLPLPLSPTATTTTTTAAAGATTTAPADRVEWSRSTILNFIEDYRRQRVLWDPNTKGYHIKQTKYEALKLLSQKYGTEIRSIRSKIKSLRSSFHREHGKVLSGRSRGVIYQPMWFAYEAIRFILDGERDQDRDQDQDQDAETETEVDEKLALMHSLDLEQLKADKLVDRDIILQVEQQQQQQHDELTARIAATVAAVAAAAAAANARDRERDVDTAGDMDTTRELELEEAAVSGGLIESSSAAVTRSSSDLDGENYCNISAEDVKTEIIEHESELGMLDRRTSTPSPINYYRPTDLTYNHRKRKAMGVEHVVGALTLTPIKVVGGAVGAGTIGSAGHQQQQQQHQQMNHSQLAFQALQQHFSHNHGLSLSHCNGQPQQQQHQPHQQQQQQQQALHLQQQQQQQHSSNMAQKRDRDRDLSTSNGNGNSSNTINNNNNNTSLDPTATSSNCSSSSSNNSAATPPKPLIGGGGLSANHVDEYGVFGEYVAITIRKLKTSKSKIVVKHLINNLLYEAELGKYDHGMPASKEPPQLYNMQ
ncbi:homeobox protein cut isoform X1 [Drosophila mauritiana]|uniref:Homeobox protein cut isoform X1 n=1 Tax=Drosophila mauritiana TaxID=7226 RepID=A0A6P8JQQ7_DROMA|nr:homeobox protein cut isoform X1 [Drosophila mauritiana]